MLGMFKPKSNEIVDLIYINAWVLDDRLMLFDGTPLFDKIRFNALKKHIRNKIEFIGALVDKQNVYDFNSIYDRLKRDDNELWYNILYTITISEVAKQPSKDFNKLLHRVLILFFLFVKENHDKNDEVLKLKLEILMILAKADLLHISGKQ